MKAMAKDLLNPKGSWVIEHRDKSGKLLGIYEFPNGIVNEGKDASHDGIPFTAQNSLKPNIENATIANESDKKISVDLKSKADPVYQSSQVNYYSSLYAEETSSKKAERSKI